MATLSQGCRALSLSNQHTPANGGAFRQTRHFCGLTLAPKLQEQRAFTSSSRTSQSVRSNRLVVNARVKVEPIGLAEKFCNEFVCTSSPAVEPTVRTLASDIERSVDGSRTLRCYSNDVTYKDSMRSFEGREKYERMHHVADSFKNAQAYISKVELEGLDLVVIEYNLKADTPAGQLDMEFTEKYKLNVISGRVVSQEVSWTNGRTGAPAMAFFTASRAAYMAAQAANDVSKTFDEALDSASPSNDFYGDPNDPMKFFQQPDNQYQDMFVFAAGATLLYAVVQVLLITN